MVFQWRHWWSNSDNDAIVANGENSNSSWHFYPIFFANIVEYDGKMKVCKLDIDANEETPPKYGIRGIPTLMLFKNGHVEATKVGALSKSQLTAFLDSNI